MTRTPAERAYDAWREQHTLDSKTFRDLWLAGYHTAIDEDERADGDDHTRDVDDLRRLLGLLRRDRNFYRAKVQLIYKTLGETIHTAFRKGCDDSSNVWQAIERLPDNEWADALAWMRECWDIEARDEFARVGQPTRANAPERRVEQT